MHSEGIINKTCWWVVTVGMLKKTEYQGWLPCHLLRWGTLWKEERNPNTIPGLYLHTMFVFAEVSKWNAALYAVAMKITNQSTSNTNACGIICPWPVLLCYCIFALSLVVWTYHWICNIKTWWSIPENLVELSLITQSLCYTFLNSSSVVLPHSVNLL